jgi:hypothetical protein
MMLFKLKTINTTNTFSVSLSKINTEPMAKTQNAKRNIKKAPVLSAKEKKQAKRNKKEKRG